MFTRTILFRVALTMLTIGAVLQACKTDETTPTVTPTSATVTGLTCGSSTFSATAVAGAAYTANATVPYTGGNAIAYTAGTAIASTGITGLNATLQAGTLATGAGNLTFAISGTPSGAGTASFAVSFGGQTCTLALPVSASATTPGTSTVVTNCTSATGLARVVCLAEAFKATLTATQIAALQLAYTKTDAVKWSNLPQALVQTKRVGLVFSSLSTTQLAAAKAAIEAAMGTGANEGYAEADAILAADDYLGANGGGTTYSAGNYYITFLGTPSTTGLWELQFGGHHLAVANTYNGGKLTGATPSFRSVEPFTAFTQAGKTYEPMVQEQKAFAAMLAGLTTAQQTTAKSASSFTDILLGPGKDAQFPTTKSGVKVGDLTQAQKDLVLAAINTYVADIDDANAATILAKYKAELDNTYVLFSGTGTMVTQNDYVRIDGPSVWIEYSTQGGIVIRTANHPHSVWRDRTGDYGGN